MIIKTIEATFGRKINTGNYNQVSIEVHLVADLPEGDDPDECMDNLMADAKDAVEEAATAFGKPLADVRLK